MNDSPLLSLPGAVAVPDGAPVAWHYGDPFREQRAALAPAGVLIDGWARGTVRVAGPDRRGWLHALTSQDFLSLGTGARSQALWLSHRGHIEHAAGVTVREGDIELDTETAEAAASLASFLLSRRLRADVTVTDVSGEVARLTVLHVNAAGSSMTAEPHTVDRAAFGERASELMRAGVAAAGTWALGALRVVTRTPAFGIDTDERTLPNEVPYWMESAVADKGCYCGQETVARIRNVGAPPRRLVLLNLDGSGGALPNPGEPVLLAGDGNDGAAVGRLGTVAQHFEDGPVALALVKRTVAPGTALDVGGVAALIDPEDVVPAGPRHTYRRRDFVDLRRHPVR